MTLSPLGIAVIQLFEDYSGVAYRKYPNEPWTCGWGHTGPDVISTTTCTPEEALEWLKIDTAIATAAVIHDVKVSITQHQFDALVSLVYNVGQVALQHRNGEVWVESTLLKLLNDKQVIQSSHEFLQWDHVDGKPDKGLLRRRQLEKALFLDGVSV